MSDSMAMFILRLPHGVIVADPLAVCHCSLKVLAYVTKRYNASLRCLNHGAGVLKEIQIRMSDRLAPVSTALKLVSD